MQPGDEDSPSEHTGADDAPPPSPPPTPLQEPSGPRRRPAPVPSAVRLPAAAAGLARLAARLAGRLSAHATGRPDARPRVTGRPRHAALRAGGVAAVGLLGALLGVSLFGSVSHRVGPVETRMSVRPGLSGGTDIRVPPLGSLRFSSHDGPAHLQVRVTELRTDAARQVVADPESLDGLSDRAAADVRDGLTALAVRVSLAAVGGAGLLCLVAFRRPRAALGGALTAVLVVGGAGGTALATYHPRALAEPRYTGLLVNAPTAVGSAQSIVDSFDRYRKQLAQLVTNVTRLYDVASALPNYEPDDRTIRVLHVSDIHLNVSAYDVMSSLIRQFGIQAVFDTGDITDYGSDLENRSVSAIRTLGVPYVYVQGNHDTDRTSRVIDRLPNGIVLNGQVREVAGLRVAGIADPVYSPDKADHSTDAQHEAETLDTGQRLANDVLRARPAETDVALVHDPVMARPLAGVVPLVLAGHWHERHTETKNGTFIRVEGSTGGAGLRALEGKTPQPLQCSVLYFDRASHRLQAYDEVTLGGLGASSVTIVRHVLRPAPPPTAAGTPGTPGTPGTRGSGESGSSG